MLLTAAVGVTIERIAYRPLRRKGANRLYVVITALMCGLILENGNLALLGASRKAFPTLIDEQVYTLGGVSFTNLKIVVIVTAVLVFRAAAVDRHQDRGSAWPCGPSPTTSSPSR